MKDFIPHHSSQRGGHKAAKSILCLLLLFVGCFYFPSLSHGQAIKPTIPGANRYQKNKVFLERADSMVSGPAGFNDSYIILKGNIEFSRGDMHLYCDSAHFYDKANSIDAYGNVRMERADRLSGRADDLHYNGNSEIVNLRGNVDLSKDSKTLTSDAIDYYVLSNTGEYRTGGKLEDEKNILTSRVGTYNFNSDKAVFSKEVVLVNNTDNYTMKTEQMNYDSRSKIVTLVVPTTITSKENKIVTNSGNYNTEAEQATLYKKNGQQPKLFAKDGRTLSGDKIHYDRNGNEGYAEGDVVLTDEKHRAILTGGYGYHNENTHVSFATDSALAKVWDKAKADTRVDTLYFHADTLKTYVEVVKKDSLRVLEAVNGARFFRKDVQGLCGFLKFSEKDSILNLYNHPVLWNGERQVYSPNEINVHMRDSSSVDWAKIPNEGLLIEHLDDIYYNQLSGKKIVAYFEKRFDVASNENKTELRHVDVEKNVKTAFYPMENDSTYNKCIKTESGFLSVDLKANQEVEKIKMWPEVTGTAIPLFIAKRNQLFIDNFRWFEELRPREPIDVMRFPEEMKQLINQPYTIVEVAVEPQVKEDAVPTMIEMRKEKANE